MRLLVKKSVRDGSGGQQGTFLLATLPGLLRAQRPSLEGHNTARKYRDLLSEAVPVFAEHLA